MNTLEPYQFLECLYQYSTAFASLARSGAVMINLLRNAGEAVMNTREEGGLSPGNIFRIFQSSHEPSFHSVNHDEATVRSFDSSCQPRFNLGCGVFFLSYGTCIVFGYSV